MVQFMQCMYCRSKVALPDKLSVSVVLGRRGKRYSHGPTSKKTPTQIP